jgi:rod shape determining protein RodA
VLRLAFLAALFMGLILFISKDAGVMLIYVFITATMALSAGFSFLWFLGAAAAVAVVTPIVWNSSLIATYQKNRILAVFDPSIDPKGTDIRYQTQRSLNAISGGGLTGQGLYQGTKTQANAIPAQHTDFIFAVIGEELGFLGCVAVMLLLAAIILRILYIGAKSQSYFHRQICVGIAGMLLFQVIINIGMCVGVMPVIGITLPFISYGGSSMLSLFIAMGVVSSVKLYPSPDSQQRYIQLPV